MNVDVGSRQKSELKLEIDATFLEKRFPNGLEMSFDARCDIWPIT